MKKLGFGLMRLPLTDAGDSKTIDHPQLNRMVDHFIEKGFTYFDTAYPYHQGASEPAIRKALVERYPREAFLLADKMPVWLVKANADYQTYFDEQLGRCGVGYFDYYLLHALDAERYAEIVNTGGFDFMVQLKAQGKARNIGFSFHDKAQVLDQILTEHPEMEFVQLQINYVDWDSDSVESRKCYEVARKHGTPVIVMEPVKGGSLANVPETAERLLRAYHPDLSVASWAVRHAASLEGVITVLSGMSNFEQLADNTGYMESFRPLNAAEQDIVAQVAEVIFSSIAIPCTACRYCVDDCPQRIPIPEYFTLFNQHKQLRLASPRERYQQAATGLGLASSCIACGQCEGHCPQHLGIIEHLKTVTRAFE